MGGAGSPVLPRQPRLRRLLCLGMIMVYSRPMALPGAISGQVTPAGRHKQPALFHRSMPTLGRSGRPTCLNRPEARLCSFARCGSRAPRCERSPPAQRASYPTRDVDQSWKPTTAPRLSMNWHDDLPVAHAVFARCNAPTRAWAQSAPVILDTRRAEVRRLDVQYMRLVRDSSGQDRGKWAPAFDKRALESTGDPATLVAHSLANNHSCTLC